MSHNQVFSYGFPAEALPVEGVQTTARDVPLGQMVTDGLRTFRWAHIAVATYSRGQSVIAAQLLPVIDDSLISGGDGHLNSATAGYGGAIKDNQIRLYGMSALTNPTKYQGGYLDVISGSGDGYTYRIKQYEIGSSGTNIITLEDELVAKLSTDTRAHIRPNEYYGLKIGGTVQTFTASQVPRGALTHTGTASGYQWIQTQGPGAAIGHQSITIGQLVGIGTSGLLSTATLLTGTVIRGTSLHSIGRALGNCSAADKYFSVNWMFE